MKTIYKYPFITEDVIALDLPKNAKILTVQVQHGTPCIWAQVDTDNVKEKRVFEVYGTGHEIKRLTKPSRREYIGTYQLFNGSIVFHLFEIISTL